MSRSTRESLVSRKGTIWKMLPMETLNDAGKDQQPPVRETGISSRGVIKYRQDKTTLL